MDATLMVVRPLRSALQPASRVAGLTEFIDVYPSLCELASIPVPGHVQGESFVKRMENPALPGKEFGIGRFGNGDTIRGEELRFSEYRDAKGKVTGTMLYDHRDDAAENINVAAARGEESRQLQRELGARKGR